MPLAFVTKDEDANGMLDKLKKKKSPCDNLVTKRSPFTNNSRVNV